MFKNNRIKAYLPPIFLGTLIILLDDILQEDIGFWSYIIKGIFFITALMTLEESIKKNEGLESEAMPKAKHAPLPNIQKVIMAITILAGGVIGYFVFKIGYSYYLIQSAGFKPLKIFRLTNLFDPAVNIQMAMLIFEFLYPRVSLILPLKKIVFKSMWRSVG